MANQKLNIDIVAKDRSKQALNGVQKSLGRLKNSVFNLRNAFIGLGAGLVLKGIVNAGMQIEELGVQLEALFGSAKKGKQALDAVTKFAKTTPFELSNIQQGVTALATVAEKAESLGISFDELLKITGNTAVQLGGDFALASQQIQKSFSAGIGSADLFRDRAVTAMAGFQVGVKTSVDDSILTLAKAFGTGGKFGELTQKLANTLKGTISNLKDAFFTIQTEIASGFFDELKNQLGDLKKFTETNDQAIRRFSKQMGENLAKGMVKVVNIGKDLIPTLQNIGKIIKSITDGFMALPPFIQQSGIIGAFLFGKKGLVALAGLSLFVDKVQDLIKESKIRMGIFDIENIDSIDAKIKSIREQINEIENNSTALNFENEGIDTSFEDNKILKLEEQLQILLKHKKTLASINKAQIQSNHHMFEMSNGAIEVAKNMETVTKFTSTSNHHLFEMANTVKKTQETFKEMNENALVNMQEKFTNIGTTIKEGLNAGITSFSMALSRAIILGEDLGKAFKSMIADALINTLAVLIEIIIRMGIQKILGIDLENQEKNHLNIMKRKTSELKKQLALQIAIMATGGGGGGNGGLFSLFGGRASGGSVQKGQPYVVGEQGAELFIPNSSGQITQSARGTGGSGTTNVNFNINATDVTGIKQLLIDNRATIVNSINSALNEKGKEALV